MIIEETPAAVEVADAEASPAGPAVTAGPPAAAGPVPWLLSARNRKALSAQATRLLTHLDDASPALPDPARLGHALATTRSTFEHRAVITGRTLDDLRAGLSAL
ncbi:CurL C-terminal domain-containing protein, partial [Streptomyces corynorhini]|uniref:CurL C-terminal domain-containing protein n=1 Tax=Streptomyces corynorhini TaxID=2282652 RepID=UPI001314FD47